MGFLTTVAEAYISTNANGQAERNIFGMPMWLFGVSLIVLQGIIAVSGVTLQRMAFLDDQRARGDRKPPIHRRRKWRFGMLLYIIAQPINAWGLTLCPISLAGPLYCATIIFASMLSSKYFEEHYGTEDVVALIIGLMGSIGIVVYGPHVSDLEKEFRISRMLVTFWKHETMNVLIPAFFLTLGACILIIMKNWKFAKIAHPLACAICGSLSDVAVKMVGMFVAQGNGFIISHLSEFLMPLILWPGFGAISLYLISKGSQKYESRFFLPAVTALISLCLAIIGAFVFKEFGRMVLAHKIIFVECAGLCTMSVLLGSMQHPCSTQSESALMELKSIAELAKNRWNRKKETDDVLNERFSNLYQPTLPKPLCAEAKLEGGYGIRRRIDDDL